jgi:hypothetical protein
MPTLTFKVTEEEARYIRAMARREKITVSEYLRRQAQPTARSAAPMDRVRCAYTGAMIFASGPDLPPLTTESVRHMLAEFP